MKSLADFENFGSAKLPKSIRENAIIYTRVSTKEQAENNTSLETQKMYCERYAQSSKLNVVALFGGTYESAKSDERKEFQKMIRYARQNNTVGVILVYSFDRFSRTGANAAYLTGELNKIGIQVISVTQIIDTSNAGGVFQQNLFYLFSQFDNEMRRDKTKTAMKELLRKGYWLWTPPRGYVNLKVHSRAVDWEIVVNNEGELLRKAFKWRANNTMSSANIVRRLNFMGMKINEKRILEIFKNPFYCGVLISKLLPNEAIQGKHEPLVSKEDFFKINKPDNISLNRTYDAMNEYLPLKKLAVCMKCGHHLTGFLNKQKNIYYYRCQKKCQGESINAEKFNFAFESLLESYRIGTSYYKEIEEIMEYKLLEITKSDIDDQANLKSQLTILKKDIETLEERHAFGKIDELVYSKYHTKYQNEIKEIEKKLGDTSTSVSNLKKCIHNGIKLSRNLSKIYASGDIFEKHKLQQILFPGGVGYDKQNERVQTFRINTIFELIQSISSDLKHKKSGFSIDNNQKSALVTS